MPPHPGVDPHYGSPGPVPYMGPMGGRPGGMGPPPMGAPPPAGPMERIVQDVAKMGFHPNEVRSTIQTIQASGKGLCSIQTPRDSTSCECTKLKEACRVTSGRKNGSLGLVPKLMRLVYIQLRDDWKGSLHGIRRHDDPALYRCKQA
eukprot:2205479-Pyramimonas_sp.AAC.1